MCWGWGLDLKRKKKDKIPLADWPELETAGKGRYGLTPGVCLRFSARLEGTGRDTPFTALGIRALSKLSKGAGLKSAQQGLRWPPAKCYSI